MLNHRVLLPTFRWLGRQRQSCRRAVQLSTVAVERYLILAQVWKNSLGRVQLSTVAVERYLILAQAWNASLALPSGLRLGPEVSATSECRRCVAVFVVRAGGKRGRGRGWEGFCLAPRSGPTRDGQITADCRQGRVVLLSAGQIR